MQLFNWAIFSASLILQCLSQQLSTRRNGHRLQTAHFLEEPTDADVIPGGTVYFTCHVSSPPDDTSANATINWRKDGQSFDLESNSRAKVHKDGTLVISGAIAADVGVYECVAEWDEGQIRSRPARLRYFRGRTKPRIVHRPGHTEVEKGETIRLSCGASGFPKPTYAWYKDGGRLSNAHSRFKVLESGTLVIKNAQLGDSAHYRCSASNYLGRTSSAARVKVNLAIPEASPQITSKPRAAKVNEGSFVEFTCVASGHPYPDITWWNNNRVVNSDGRIVVSNGGQHLRIGDTKPYDSGDYVCRAENRLGQIEATAVLTVKEKPMAVTLVTIPHDMTAPMGSTVQMPCKAQGSPKPTISWRKDGHDMTVLQSSRHKVGPDGSLVVYNVTQQDAGRYECVAENGRETRTASARFVVRATRHASQNPVNKDKPVTVGSYRPGRPLPGDDFLLIALEEATLEVDKALNATVERLFSETKHAANSTPSELIRIFRYPPESQRDVAKAAEVYERTLELVAQKVYSSEGEDWQEKPKFDNFSYVDLISPANLELLANLSGCEAHRARREVNCTADMCFHAKYRSVDGTCNNLQNPLWGSSLTAFRRILPAKYENGFNTPVGWTSSKLHNGFKLPSARKVSSQVITTTKVTPDADLSHMVMQWGQFLDHDLDHAMEAISRETFENGITCSATCGNRPPCYPIKIPPGDHRIRNRDCMEFTRSSAACGSGSTSVFFDKLQQREQLNQLTSYLDASQVYGSSDDLAISLRNLTNEFGRLREGLTFDYGKPLLPFNTRHVVDCRRDPRESNIGCFLAGDVRANEQVALLSMHTIWFREHNRLATQLRQLNPSWDSDTLYEESRKIVGAEMQHITFNHWLPSILGPEGMEMLGTYKGYQPDVEVSISNVFAASAFRFGHTLVNPVLKRLNATFQTIGEGDLTLNQAFFAPWRLVQEGGVDPILRGLFATSAKLSMPNEVMNSELTEHLFSAAHSVALDLGALNIQRGRDHGLPSYVEWRQKCGLGTANVNRWSELADVIKASDIRSKLHQLYGHPANLDLWVGGLLEDLVEGGRVGPTVRCLLVEQFRRLRDGDRFWYENPSTFKPEQLSQIKQTSLAKVLCDNGDELHKVSRDVFRLGSGDDAEQFVDCKQISSMSLDVWMGGCDKDHEEGRLSRVRRTVDYTYMQGHVANLDDDPSEDRIEGLEEALRKTNVVMHKMRRRMKRLLRRLAPNTQGSVCIDIKDQLHNEGETWTHHTKNGTCVDCICKDHVSKCFRKTCPALACQTIHFSEDICCPRCL